jgi:hypothetical protein
LAILARMTPLRTCVLLTLASAAACGDGGSAEATGTDAASTGGSADDGGSAPTSAPGGDGDPTSGDSVADDTGDSDGGSSDTGDPPPGECAPFGHFGAPRTTFVLPAREGTGIYHPDVQASFPEVDWSTLDRLYVPAGQYTSMNLGNLPERTADRPLVITNMGGQVRIGPNDPDGNYLWVMSGGSNWILTGRWDPDSGTGDESAPGHRCGDYAGSRGHYGFWSDDAFAQREFLHMGIAVGNASSYELEYLEIERSGFAGIRLLNSWTDGELPMADVRVHDNYVHDVDGEGIYFGWTGSPPSNLIPGLKVHDNRFIRTGNEALQIQDIGPGTEIHHNVIAFAALHWRDNGLGAFQDSNAQISIREGDVQIHHNVFMGGAGTLLSFWSGPQDGDGERMVVLSDNYVAEVRNLAFYFGGSSGPGSSFAFTDNVFRGMEFTYDALDPEAVPPTSVVRIAAGIEADVTLQGNRWDGDLALVQGGAPTVMDNVQGAVEPIEFVESGYPEGEDVLRLEVWTAASTLAPGSPPRDYVIGDLVMHDARMYRAIADNTGEVPPEHPESWELLPDPVDDLRVPAGSPYAEMGIR